MSRVSFKTSGLKIAWISVRRRVRQLFGLSTPWQEMSRSARRGRDIDTLSDFPIIEYARFFDPKRKYPTKEEWERLVRPTARYGEYTNVGS